MEIRNKKVCFRVSGTEAEQIKIHAHEAGMTVPDYLRARAAEGLTRVFYDPEVSDILRGAREELRQLTVGMNSVAAKVTDEDEASREHVRQAEEILRQTFSVVRNYEKTLESMRGG